MTKILIDRAVVEQALEALGKINKLSVGENAICLPAEIDGAMDALRAALAEPVQEPVQEPVAWRVQRSDGQYELYFLNAAAKRAAEGYIKRPPVEPLYTAPPQRPAEPEQEPVGWLQPRTLDGYLRPDLGYETCSKSDYGAFPVYTAPPQRNPLTPSSPCEMTPAERKMFKLGWLECEAAHGIKEKK